MLLSNSVRWYLAVGGCYWLFVIGCWLFVSYYLLPITYSPFPIPHSPFPFINT